MADVLTREAVGIFDDQDKLDAAVAELEISSFARHEINVLGDPKEIENRFGEEVINPQWLEDNPYAPRKSSIRPEEKRIGRGVAIAVPAYIGGCAAMLAVNPAPGLVLLGAVVAGSILGALVGGAITYFINRKITRRVDDQIQEGGLLLWVKTPAPEKEKLALNILHKYGGRNVHVHDIA